MKNIPYGRQNICETDIRGVVDVLKSYFLTKVPMVQKIECV